MGRRYIIFFLVLLTVAASAALAQNSEASQQGRKVVSRVTPVYPDLARGMQISGVVKLWVTVSPSGSVKSIEPVGGNPVLIKAAQDAVRVWKYARAPEETRELIELHFNMR
jgi:TonB family protein